MRPQAKAVRKEKVLLGKQLPSPVWAGTPESPLSQASTEEGRRKGNRGSESHRLAAAPQGAPPHTHTTATLTLRTPKPSPSAFKCRLPGPTPQIQAPRSMEE